MSDTKKTELTPWICKKCKGHNMIIVSDGRSIKVFCAKEGCLEPFPQLQVKTIPTGNESPPGATKIPTRNPMGMN